MPSTLEKVDILILCGGMGSRLSEVFPGIPKGLAPIKGKPFLDILIEELIRQGFRRFIFCVGHLKQQIINRYSVRSDAEFLFSQEDFPLGTGGAVKNAELLIQSNPFFVVNGDSFCQVDLRKFYHFHQAKAGLASFVLAKVNNRHDGGVFLVDEKSQIKSFLEKPDIVIQNGMYVNAGIYLLQKKCFDPASIESSFSLEFDLFPKIINLYSCFGFICENELIDIGTPERYRKINNDEKFI